MSQEELRRVEVLARVKSEELRVVDAATLLRVSYRQAKRLWKRFREEGAAGLKHGNAGQSSHHAYEAKFRQKALQLVREKYSGTVGERFGPTLAAEHLESEDGVKVRCGNATTLDVGKRDCGVGSGNGDSHRQRRERKGAFRGVSPDGRELSCAGWRSAARRAV